MAKKLENIYKKEKKDITFEKCGLDIKKNFISAPPCPCGCGGPSRLIAKGKDDILSFGYGICQEEECMRCAVFIVTDEKRVLAIIKYDEMIQSLESKENVSLDSIGTLANGLELHRYGLICWVEGDEYEIIEK